MSVLYRRTKPVRSAAREAVPLLRNGDRLSQVEFHRRYEAHPDNTKFELIDGVVYMASPMSLEHSEGDLELSVIFALYKGATPGVGAGPNATVILGDESEPQPDHHLRILPNYGGKTSKKGKYLSGGPELIAEIAFSSVSIDLHKKKSDYRRAGVCEYLVVCLEEEVVRWFDLTQDRELTIDSDGILRSWMFPGLWIDTTALFQSETNRLVGVLQQGLATPEHAEFVASLQERRLADEPPKAKGRVRKPSSRKRGKRRP